MTACFMVEPVRDPVTLALEYTPEEHGSRSPVMRRVDTGERVPYYTIGSMWYEWESTWDEAHQELLYQGLRAHPSSPDGKSLVVILPNGHAWYIDGHASNCTWKDRSHCCWSRTGAPPLVTVGKGPPCSDGAGSIKSPGYHGHLANGEFSAPLADSNS